MADASTDYVAARSSKALDSRIAENRAGQSLDLVSWIFQSVKVQPGARILELCSGTGGQTHQLLALSGTAGEVVASDVSAESLSRIEADVADDLRRRLRTVAADMDDLVDLLPPDARFDIVFCAYGLYYSSDPIALLDRLRRLLSPDGRIVVVGPFGRNNEQLFEMLQVCGVELPAYVTESSGAFMTGTVLPWAAHAFGTLSIHTVVNQVSWTQASRLLNYWRNTTFYDASAEPEVNAQVERAIAKDGAFTNDKWIMLTEMIGSRLGS